MLWTAQVKESAVSAVTQYKITLLIQLGNYMVCHKTYHVIKHGTNNKLTFPILQITIHLHLQLAASHSLVDIPPFYPGTDVAEKGQ